MKRNSFLKASGLCLIFLLGLALLFSCTDKKDNPTQSASSRTIVTSLNATPDSVAVGNTAIISALVTTSGQIDSGEVVAFSASSGTFSQTSDTSDANGIVSTIYTGITAGSVYISATTSDTVSTISIRVYSSSTGEGALSIQVNPTILPANGDTTSQVTVRINDSNGNPVPNGTIVRLAAGEKFTDVDGDGYYNKNIDELIYDSNNDGVWNPIGDISMTVATTSGTATATYTAGYRAGMVYVKATTGSPDDPVSDDASILLIPTSGDTIASIALAPASPTIQVKGTGGIEFVQMTATCYDVNGNHVIQGWPVTFYILNGPDGGENINGIADSVTVTTNSSGMAQITVNSGTVSGTINLIARYGSVISNSTRITICAGPPAFISIGRSPCNIRGLDVVNVEAHVTGIVVDIYGNYVPDGTSVYFTVDEGMITPNDETDKGLVEATYRSAPKFGDDGVAWIIAETEGGNIADTVILVVSGAPFNVDFLGYPSSGITASSDAKSTILVGVKDVNGNPVLPGFKVDFEAIYGSIEDALTETTCVPGEYAFAQSKYTSTNLEVDYAWSAPDNGIGAYEVVSATCGGAGGYATFPLLTGLSYKDETDAFSRIIAESEIDLNSIGSFEVKIIDRFGNPLGGHFINVLNISNGAISGLDTNTTDANGSAMFIFTSTADSTKKAISIVVADTADARGNLILSKKINLIQHDST